LVDLPRVEHRGVIVDEALGARSERQNSTPGDIILSLVSYPIRLTLLLSRVHISDTTIMARVQVAKSNDNGQHPTVKKYRYKHTLRKSPYFVSLVFLLIATVLTILNIYVSGSNGGSNGGSLRVFES